MTTGIREQAQRRDRWVSWLVIGVFLVALLLGWVVKAAAEGRTVAHEAGNLRVRYPAGWVRTEAEPPVLLRVEDRWAAPFRTTLTLQRRPLPPDGEKPVGIVQQALTLERARDWTAYRVLRMEESASIEGRTGMRVTFAYVETNPNPFLETVPVVMYGEDFLFPVGDQVYIVTLTAAEANYARGQKALRAFLRSLQVER